MPAMHPFPTSPQDGSGMASDQVKQAIAEVKEHNNSVEARAMDGHGWPWMAMDGHGWPMVSWLGLLFHVAPVFRCFQQAFHPSFDVYPSCQDATPQVVTDGKVAATPGGNSGCGGGRAHHGTVSFR